MIQRNVIIIAGKTGSGKSTLTKEVMEKSQRVVVLDPMEEYSGTVVYTFQQFVDYMQTYHPHTFRIVCRFEDDLDIEYLFKGVWVMMKEYDLADCLLVVEELDSYVNPRDDSTPFMQIIKRGRHRRLHILGVAQRTPQFSRTLRAQKTTFITFAVDEPGDVDVLLEYGFTWEQLEGLTLENHQYATIGVNINDISFETENAEGVFSKTVIAL